MVPINPFRVSKSSLPHVLSRCYLVKSHSLSVERWPKTGIK